MYCIEDLTEIDLQLQPLKSLADKELRSIFGLTGLIYTPHIDAYMKVSVEKAKILTALKKQGSIPYSDVEKITLQLELNNKSTRNKSIVEHLGKKYERRFTPLKMTKSGKNVQKWAKFWLLQLPNGDIDQAWEEQVKEIWPSYFLIRINDI